MEYVEVADAITAPGLRLVLTAGVPGPWGESAKSIFHVKGLSYTPVRQLGGAENAELRAWTGRDNAPIAVYGDEPGRDGWADILELAERLAPAPPLLPDDVDDRVRMFGLCHEICGPGGFGWQRRTQILSAILDADLPDAAKATPRRIAAKYGYSPDAARRADRRVADVLRALSAQLRAQRAAGRRYFVGEALTALDIYWACFAAMVEPMAPDRCPMPDAVRHSYALREPSARAAADPVLLEHRDFVYEHHLRLPLEF